MNISSLFTLAVALVAFSLPIAAGSKLALGSKDQKMHAKRMQAENKFREEVAKDRKRAEKERARQAKMTPQKRHAENQRITAHEERMAPLREKNIIRKNERDAQHAVVKENFDNNLKKLLKK